MPESGLVKYWEIIADNLHKAGSSYGYVSAVQANEAACAEHRCDIGNWALRCFIYSFHILRPLALSNLGPFDVIEVSVGSPWPALGFA